MTPEERKALDAEKLERAYERLRRLEREVEHQKQFIAALEGSGERQVDHEPDAPE